jgi:isopentenyl-diphosphate Delta-isomerase
MQINDKVVSSESELLVVVDEQDNIVDYKSKAECHNGDGILHRAFSIFIFDDKMQLLIQKRSDQKRLWPLYWSNSCCSHPRKDEVFNEATIRRTEEELGFTTPLTFLFKFQYSAKFGDEGSEREVCSVFAGKSNKDVTANPNEIAEWKYIDQSELEKDFEKNPDDYSPWFKMEWERIRKDHLKEIEKL